MEFTNFIQITIAIHSKSEVLMDKTIYERFAVLKLSKFLMYETYYDKLQPYFGQENLQLQYLDTDSFVLSVSKKDIINDLKNLADLFNFSNLDENHEIFSNEKYIFAFSKIDTPKNIWIDKFICQKVRCMHINVETIVKIN